MSQKIETAQFKFYPGEYLRDTQNLSESQQVAYDRIMCEHIRYNQVDAISVSISQLRFFTKRLTPEEKEEIMLVLEEVSTPNGPGFCIPWVAREVRKALNFNRSRVNNLNKNDIEPHMGNHIGIRYNKESNESKKEIKKEKGGAGEKTSDRTAEKIMIHLIELSGRVRMDPKNANSQKFILARLKEGYTEEDLIQIIEIMTLKWKGDAKMEQYLRAETLFNREKCAQYRLLVQEAKDKGSTAEEIKGAGKYSRTAKGMDANDLARAAMSHAKDVFK